jgi:hypothetical protein
MNPFNSPHTSTVYHCLASIWTTIARSYKLHETPNLLDDFISTTFLATSNDKGLKLTANTEWTDVTTAYSEYIDRNRDSNIQQPDVRIIETTSSNPEARELQSYICLSNEAVIWTENVSKLVQLKARFLFTSLQWLNNYSLELSQINMPSGNNSIDNHCEDHEGYDSSNTDSFDKLIEEDSDSCFDD